MIRVSTNMMHQQKMQDITNGQSLLMQTNKQLATEKRVNNPSDDPLAASQAVMVAQAEAENNRYTLARNFARQKMSLEESTLQHVTLTIGAMQDLVINVANDSLNDDDRNTYATELQGLKDQLLNLANSTDSNGHYMFAAFKSNRAPFVANGAGQIDYRGGDIAIEQQVDRNRIMTAGHTGRSIFMSLAGNLRSEPNDVHGNPVPSEANIFNTIDTVLTSLRTPLNGAPAAVKQVAMDALDKGNRGLNNSFNNVLSVRTELGIQLEELDKLDSLGSDRTLINTERLHDLLSADPVATISLYRQQQDALQAMYKTFSDMQGMSLFQINR